MQPQSLRDWLFERSIKVACFTNGLVQKQTFSSASMPYLKLVIAEQSSLSATGYYYLIRKIK